MGETKVKPVQNKEPVEKMTLIQSMRELVYKEVEDNMDLFVNPFMDTSSQLEFYNRKAPFLHKYEGRLKSEAKVVKFVGLCFKQQRVMCERLKLMMTYVDLDKSVRDLFYSKKTLKSLFKVLSYNSKLLRESVVRLVLMIHDKKEKLR